VSDDNTGNYVERARELYGDDDLTVDDDAVVSDADGGAWVAAWVWVPDDNEPKVPLKPMRLQGSELKVGDTIEVWWAPRRDTITELKPYNGPLAYLFKGGAQLATFALHKSGMTIDNADSYDVIARQCAAGRRRPQRR